MLFRSDRCNMLFRTSIDSDLDNMLFRMSQALSYASGECRSLLQHVRSHVDQLRVTAAYRRVIARTCRPMTVQCPTIECLCPKMPGYGWGMVGHKNLQIFPKFSKIFENLPKFRKNRENPKKPDFCENLRKFAIFWGGPKKVKF